MQGALLLMLLVLAATFTIPAVAAGTGERVTPVEKVIELLTGMLEKGKQEKHEEQVQFAAYQEWCEGTAKEKKRAIAEAEEQIEILESTIQLCISNIKILSKEIAEHEADIAAWTGDIKASTKVRDLEKADYEKMIKDYNDAIDALQRAIQVLKEQAHDRKQSDKTVGKYGELSMAQVTALQGISLIPDGAKKAINTFLAQDPESFVDVSAAPEANAYEFQSHGVIEMLEKLLDKFMDERTSLEKEEMQSQHAFELLLQDLTQQIDDAKNGIEQKTGALTKQKQEKADAEGDLEDTKATLEDDKKYLADLLATCDQKASDFEERQTLRAEEIKAIEKAIEIISGEAVKGNAEKHLPSLLQSRKAALAQLRSDGQSPAQQRVAEYLQTQGKELNSPVLSALAIRVAEDPFKKVKKMIKDLIVKLMEQANEEAEHKGWCDKELAVNEQTRKEKTMAVETLHSEIDELQASIAQLALEITELTQAVAALDEAMAKATTIRQEEKAKNTATTKDSQEAQAAVAQALVVLKEFYAKAAEATALIQQPEIFDSPYKGMQGESGGVIGMLEVIESDFARLEAETKAAEETAQKDYDEFMTDSQVDKAAKNKDIEHKTAKKQDQEQSLVLKKEDLDGTQKELDAALAYFEKLKPSCVGSGVSYEERVARRKEEIQSLQEALKILNGEDVA